MRKHIQQFDAELDKQLKELMMQKEDDLLKEIERTAEQVKYTGNELKATAKPDLMLEACQRAAEMVRDLQKTHAAEGETLAMHLESVGKTFNEMCQDAAKQVRELRIMPKEMAEQTADDLLKLGQEEAQRHQTVSTALLAARDALLSVNEAAPASPASKTKLPKP